MPIGTPDFGQNVSTNPTAPSFDNGEDVTRLLMGGGSQARSGRWVFATGFEEGTFSPFYLFQNGTGVVTIDGSNSYQGINSAKIAPSNAINDYNAIAKYLLLPGAKYGVEFMFAKSHAGFTNSELHIQISGSAKGENKDKNNIGIIVIKTTNAGVSTLQWDVNGVRTDLANLTLYIQDFSRYWHYVKFVFDINENYGVRIYFDDLILNIPTLQGRQIAGTNPINSIIIKGVNLQAASSPVWLIDNLVITADEP